MIAKVSSDPVSILDEMLECPYSLEYLSRNGRQHKDPRQRGPHRDGCGLAYTAFGEIHLEKRTRENVWDASYIAFVEEARSRCFLAHNRKTSEGLATGLGGTHPFYAEKNGLQYAFCHNGTAESLLGEAKAQNTSDSKLFFAAVLGHITMETPGAFAAALEDFAKHNTYDSLTGLLLCSDESLYAWRIVNVKDPAERERLERYYTLYVCWRNGSLVVASEPLDDLPWMLLPNHTMLQLRPGAHCVHAGFSDLHIS